MFTINSSWYKGGETDVVGTNPEPFCYGSHTTTMDTEVKVKESHNGPLRLQVSYSTNTSTRMSKNVLENLNDEQRNVVRKIGFGSLLNLEALEVDIDLLSCLVVNFDCERCTLNVHG